MLDAAGFIEEEPAAAFAPAGQQVPCKTLPKPSKAPKAGSGGGWGIALWGKVVGALIMVFYAVRGIFLLLVQLLKPKKRSATKPPPPKPVLTVTRNSTLQRRQLRTTAS